jgi:hypothetical protein
LSRVTSPAWRAWVMAAVEPGVVAPQDSIRAISSVTIMVLVAFCPLLPDTNRPRPVAPSAGRHTRISSGLVDGTGGRGATDVESRCRNVTRGHGSQVYHHRQQAVHGHQPCTWPCIWRAEAGPGGKPSLLSGLPQRPDPGRRISGRAPPGTASAVVAVDHPLPCRGRRTRGPRYDLLSGRSGCGRWRRSDTVHGAPRRCHNGANGGMVIGFDNRERFRLPMTVTIPRHQLRL